MIASTYITLNAFIERVLNDEFGVNNKDPLAKAKKFSSVFSCHTTGEI